MNINKTIHEAMGFKWRELTAEKREFKFSSGCPSVTFTDFVCKCCDGPQSGCNNTAPDYTAPIHYYNLFKWMRNDDRWRVFGNWLMREHGDSQFRFLMKVEEHQITLIAEAIEAGVLT